jgi:hypothetical protein
MPHDSDRKELGSRPKVGPMQVQRMIWLTASSHLSGSPPSSSCLSRSGWCSESRCASREDCQQGRALTISKKFVGAGGAGGVSGSGVTIGNGTDLAMEAVGERWTETGMASCCGREGRTTHWRGNLWVCRVRDVSREEHCKQSLPQWNRRCPSHERCVGQRRASRWRLPIQEPSFCSRRGLVLLALADCLDGSRQTRRVKRRQSCHEGS